jgi:hypothetical protein
MKTHSPAREFPSDLSLLRILLFDKCRLSISAFQSETESLEYAACFFKLNQKHIRFRSSKITPKKVGQFVTVWKRNQKGIIQPFTKSDALDYLIICSRSEMNFGVFIFPKSILNEKNIITGKNEGKRGIRVYPSWDRCTNKEAKKTQQWQTKYFLACDGEAVDIGFAKSLFA